MIECIVKNLLLYDQWNGNREGALINYKVSFLNFCQMTNDQMIVSATAWQYIGAAYSQSDDLLTITQLEV